jgi:hypothetical protein
MNTPDNDSDELDPQLRAIVRAAGDLPELSPSRDLWSGIESRIEARVVALPTRIAQDAVAAPHVAPHVAPRVAPAALLPWRQLAIAASLLIAVTAGVTYTLTKRNGPELAVTSDSATVDAPILRTPVEQVSLQTAEQTFDHEIGAMRTIIAERRKELDPVTLAVLTKNMKLIDTAISESKAALAKDPASAFLLDRLTHAYDTKLQLLREVANIPSHG